MNKLKMAHEYFMKHGRNNSWMESDVIDAWKYADAMQAEANKRAVKLPDVFFDTKQNEEWQPDWSQAPEWAEYWYMTKDNKFQWCSKRPYQDGCNWFVNCSSIYTLDVAPTFGYTGNWRDSLRKRP